MPADPLHSIDYDAFARDLDALRAEVDASLGPADLDHLRKLEGWGRFCTLAGYATAGVAPNLLSMALLAQGNVAQWTIMMHHVGHKGMDRVPGVPERLTSKAFARGLRRLVDWPDWILPAAWHHEHNTLHHYRTGELADPDLVEENVTSVRDASWPKLAKYAAVAFYAGTWKLTYYAPNTFQFLKRAERRRASRGASEGEAPDRLWQAFDLRTADGREFWGACVLPYAIGRFVAVPALFAPLGPWSVFSAWANSVGAELWANIYSFALIAPNHAGDDLYRFDRPTTDRAEFYVRQVTGSVNFSTGGDVRDFLHGFLNYQIEHHIWPDLPPAAYQRVQPRVREICERHGVPYVQQPLWARVKKLVAVMVGDASMLRGNTLSRRERGASTAGQPIGGAAAEAAEAAE
jgi:fatty acid desaturase